MTSVFSVRAGASEDRLAKLINERLQPGADTARIDARLWDLFGEEWAVMFTDLSGFSRQVAEFGIIHFLQVILEAQRILIPCIDGHDGILLKLEGDSMLVIFRNVKKSIGCAIAMQRAVKEYNRGRPDTEQILLCIGLGFGKMLRIGDQDVFGAEVNAASKLGEDTARAWEILVTDNVKRKAGKRAAGEFTRLPAAPPGASAAWRLRYRL